MRIKYAAVVASNYRLLPSLNVLIKIFLTFNNNEFRILSIIYFELNTLFLFSSDKRRGSYPTSSKICS